MDYIEKLEFGLKDGFMDKFGTQEVGLLEFLYFVDLLGWNEDVKYNHNGNEPLLSTNKSTGRVKYFMKLILNSIKFHNFRTTNNLRYNNLDLAIPFFNKLEKLRKIKKSTNNEFKYFMRPYLTF